MTALDREQLKRDCADTLEVLHCEQRVDGLAELSITIRTLGRSTGPMASCCASRCGPAYNNHLAPDPHAREARAWDLGEAIMARKRKARAAKKTAKRTAAKGKPVARRNPTKKKPARRARPRTSLTPVAKDVLTSGIYGGDPTSGQIATPPPGR